MGMINTGIADVQVEVMAGETQLFAAALANNRVIPGEQPVAVTPATPSTPEATPAQDTSVSPAIQMQQVNQYVLVRPANRADAEAIRDRMARLGNATVEEESGVFKVYVGPLSSRLEAQAMLGRVFAGRDKRQRCFTIAYVLIPSADLVADVCDFVSAASAQFQTSAKQAVVFDFETWQLLYAVSPDEQMA